MFRIGAVPAAFERNSLLGERGGGRGEGAELEVEVEVEAGKWDQLRKDF